MWERNLVAVGNVQIWASVIMARSGGNIAPNALPLLYFSREEMRDCLVSLSSSVSSLVMSSSTELLDGREEDI